MVICALLDIYIYPPPPAGWIRAFRLRAVLMIKMMSMPIMLFYLSEIAFLVTWRYIAFAQVNT